MRWFCSVVVVLVVTAGCSGDDGAAEPYPATSTDVPMSTSSAATTTTTLRPPPPTDPPERDDPTIGDPIIPCQPVDRSASPERPGVDEDVFTIGTGSVRGGIGTPGAGVGIIEIIEVLADH